MVSNYVNKFPLKTSYSAPFTVSASTISKYLLNGIHSHSVYWIDDEKAHVRSYALGQRTAAAHANVFCQTDGNTLFIRVALMNGRSESILSRCIQTPRLSKESN